jgi:(2Fe-2S) ferredoxin
VQNPRLFVIGVKGEFMIQRPQPYIRQIHICINNRNGESPSCGYSGSEEVVEELRKVCKERNLKGKIRVVRSGCLDVCAFGPNMMIWPEGLWYMKVTKEDVPQIIDKYLKLEEADQTKAAGAAAK